MLCNYTMILIILFLNQYQATLKLIKKNHRRPLTLDLTHSCDSIYHVFVNIIESKMVFLVSNRLRMDDKFTIWTLRESVWNPLSYMSYIYRVNDIIFLDCLTPSVTTSSLYCEQKWQTKSHKWRRYKLKSSINNLFSRLWRWTRLVNLHVLQK